MTLGFPRLRLGPMSDYWDKASPLECIRAALKAEIERQGRSHNGVAISWWADPMGIRAEDLDLDKLAEEIEDAVAPWFSASAD